MNDDADPIADDLLRDALRGHADRVAGASDPGRLERRMTRVDRRRTAARIGSVAAVGIVVVGGALLLGRGGGDDAQDTITTGSSAVEETTSAPRPTVTTGPTSTTPETTTPPTDPTTDPTSTTSAPPEGTTPVTPPKIVPGTCEVAQESDSSTANPPVGIYTGRAAPGTTVRVQAKDGYGSAQTIVDATGDWRLEVTFTGAPANQPFEVWGGCPDLQAKTIFEFTWVL